MKLTTIALNTFLGLMLAGLIVPLGLLVPQLVPGDWMAAVAIAVCIAAVFFVRRDKAHF